MIEDAWASVPLTLPSHATILSGLEPPHHGVHDNGTYVFPPEPPTLATLLAGPRVRDRRLRRRLRARPALRSRARVRRTTTTHRAAHERRQRARVRAPRGDGRGRGRGVDRVRRRGPFLAWVHLYDPHAPYDPPPPFRERFAGRPYDGEIAYADACLGRRGGRAPASARRTAWWSLVTADHGEGLGDHGERTHGFFVYRPTLRVPLHPGRRRGAARRAARGPGAQRRHPADAAGACSAWPRRRAFDGVDLLRTAAPRGLRGDALPADAGLGAAARAARRIAASSSTRRGPSCTTSPTTPARRGTCIAERAAGSGAAARRAGGAPRERARRPRRGRGRSARLPSGCARSATWRRPPPGGDVGARRGPEGRAAAVAALRGGELGRRARRRRGRGPRAARAGGRASRGTPPSGARSRPSPCAAPGRAREAAAAAGGARRVATRLPGTSARWPSPRPGSSTRRSAARSARSPSNPRCPRCTTTSASSQASAGSRSRGAARVRRGRAPRSQQRARAGPTAPTRCVRWAARRRRATRTRPRIRLAPDDADALNGLGVLAVQSGAPDEAAQLFRRVLERDPDLRGGAPQPGGGGAASAGRVRCGPAGAGSPAEWRGVARCRAPGAGRCSASYKRQQIGSSPSDCTSYRPVGRPLSHSPV